MIIRLHDPKPESHGPTRRQSGGFKWTIDRRDLVIANVRRQESQLLDVDNFDRQLININREEPTQWFAVNEIQPFT